MIGEVVAKSEWITVQRLINGNRLSSRIMLAALSWFGFCLLIALENNKTAVSSSKRSTPNGEIISNVGKKCLKNRNAKCVEEHQLKRWTTNYCLHNQNASSDTCLPKWPAREVCSRITHTPCRSWIELIPFKKTSKTTTWLSLASVTHSKNNEKKTKLPASLDYYLLMSDEKKNIISSESVCVRAKKRSTIT